MRMVITIEKTSDDIENDNTNHDDEDGGNGPDECKRQVS